MATTLARTQVEALRRHPNDPRQHIDWLLFASIIGLAAVGLLAIYSARYQSQTLNGLDPYFFVKRQGVALAVGFLGMLAVLAVDYRRWRDLAPWFYAATTLSLVALLLVGQSRKGAVAWFEVGGFQLQPSEFAKITLILILAAYLGSGERADGLPFNASRHAWRGSCSRPRSS